MGDADLDDSEGGWKKSPVVGCAAGGVILITLIIALCRINCGGGGEGPVVGGKVTMICPHCNEVHKVSLDDVGVPEDASADEAQDKARNAPCPKCGKTDSVVAATCRKCGKPFAPPTTREKLEDLKCPHCGERPWGR